MKLLFENWKKYLTELQDFDFSTLQLKDTLEPNLWQKDELNPEIKEKLKDPRVRELLKKYQGGS